MFNSMHYVSIMLLSIGIFSFTEAAMIKPNPIISRGTGVIVKVSAGDATGINDKITGYYEKKKWPVSNNSWIALKVVSGTYTKAFLIWNSPDTSWSDSIGISKDSCKNVVGKYPADYDILTSSNSTDGNDGDWIKVDSVIGNRVAARGHLVNFTGANWIKINIIKGSGSIDEVEVFDASNGLEDSWFFLGSKFTALMFKGPKGSGYTTRDKSPKDSNFALMINNRNAAFTPAVISGGVYCSVTSSDVVRDLSKYLSIAGNVNFWAIELGTYDARSGSNISAATFKSNLKTIIDSCKNRGIHPIIARVPTIDTTKLKWQIHDFVKAIDDLTKDEKLIPGVNLLSYFNNTAIMGNADLDNTSMLPNQYGDFEAQREWNLKMDSVVYKAPPVGIAIPHVAAVSPPIAHFSVQSHGGRLTLSAGEPGTVTFFATDGRIITDVSIVKSGSITRAAASGCYLIKFTSAQGTVTKRIVNY